MRRLIFIAFFGVALLSSTAVAEEFARVSAAAQPLVDGVPQVAVVRLRELLKLDLPLAERTAAETKLAEALVAANQPAEALQVLNSASAERSGANVFFRAQAFASLGHWTEALTAYQLVAADQGSALRADAQMGEAEAERALGRTDDALRSLSQLHRDPRWRVHAQLRSVSLLIDKHDIPEASRLLAATHAKSTSEKKEKRFLRGELEAAQGRREKAIELFGTILQKPEGASYGVLIGSLFALADAHLALRTPEVGDDALENFIDHYGASSELAPVFAKLDQLYSAERKPSRRELARWANDPLQPRRVLAQWYLARLEARAGRREEAVRLFEQIRASGQHFPALAEAYLQFAQVRAEDRRYDDALALLEDARACTPEKSLLDRVDFLAGDIHYRASQWEASARAFENEAKSAPEFAADALYNASSAWLQAKDTTRFLADARELSAVGADENTRGDLVLEQGLVRAAQGDSKTTDALQNFVRDFPKHPRVSEAFVTLAELAFHAAPPRIADAEKFLTQASENNPTPIAEERADYLRLWIADANPDPNAPGVITLANEFLQRHPQSAFIANVRMKLAEASFRRHDFASAQTQFELLAQQNPNSELTEKALFFAAESALQSMGTNSLDRALALLGEVVKRGGEMKWAARNEQAMVERKLAKTADALTLYDEVLKGDAKTAEKREALCGKADIAYDSAANDPEKYRAAIDLYQQLATEAATAPHWRNQALFKAGVCFEKIGDRPRALDTFYKVIEETERPDRPSEFFWFYKAGFNAARLLEDESKWEPAASIYDKLTAAGGDRSDEAKSRLARLRLEHFLWDR